jgi:hypothetical protein
MKRTEEEMQRIRERYQSVPEHALVKTKKKKSSPTNQLTADITEYAHSLDCAIMRVNSQGQYNEKLGKWTHSGSMPGISDLIIIKEGRVFFVELKIGKDKQNENQIKFMDMVRRAGANYFICSSLDSFKMQFEYLINTDNGKDTYTK